MFCYNLLFVSSHFSSLVWFSVLYFLCATGVGEYRVILETKASSHEGQCIPAGSIVSPPRRPVRAPGL